MVRFSRGGARTASLSMGWLGCGERHNLLPCRLQRVSRLVNSGKRHFGTVALAGVILCLPEERAVLSYCRTMTVFPLVFLLFSRRSGDW